MFYAHIVPPVGGETECADLRAAYVSLPAEVKIIIDGLVAEHSIFHSRGQLGFSDYSDAEHPGRPPLTATSRAQPRHMPRA
jgi:alpha-ketoglutarate-dependent 2,4-dichlorophenoxyacetate dioxygenase